MARRGVNDRALGFEHLEARRMLAVFAAFEPGDIDDPPATNTLRWAIEQANTTANTTGGTDTVVISGDLLASGLQLQQGALKIKEPVTIHGNGLDIFGPGGVFDIDIVSGPLGTVRISGFDMSSSGSAVRISAVPEATSVQISSNNFEQNAIAITIDDGLFSQLEVRLNEFRNNGYGISMDGATFDNQPGKLDALFEISQNIFENNSSGGIYFANVETAPSPTHIVVTNNSFFNNGTVAASSSAAIRFYNADAPFQISDNTIGRVSPTFGAGNAGGIRVEHVSTSGASLIELNVIGGNTYDGIYINDSDLPNLEITQNNIGIDATETYTLPNGGSGISMRGSTIGEIDGNILADNGSHGIELVSDSAAADISANQILLNDLDGIFISSGASNFNSTKTRS
jgi:Right handed beta helix region